MPLFGTVVLYLILLSAAFAFATAVAGSRGNARLLQTSRLATYAMVALVVLGVLALAYAFVTHDFRIRYVHRYSDRSMPLFYVLTSLWGGQDGSLLWWVFILSMFTAACVFSLRGRYLALQPYVIATLNAVTMIFVVIMLFSANPFAIYPTGAPPDGRGLNPLLQNIYMTIHPPSLYIGFVGTTVPFAFMVAALATRRLDEEWIHAARRWTLFAFLFLSIGNILGGRWAYEELGWGGFWAWDPVENAALMPWFTTTAFLHSVMIQERRGMLKVWNVFLVSASFFMSIFGTFLTRSGLIKSVHSFAQSSIGWYFVVYLAVILLFTTPYILYRLDALKSRNKFDSVLSREAAFLVNNLLLLTIMLFILFATMFPKLSELFVREEITMGPAFFNKLLRPPGVALLVLTGIGPLIGWRRQTGATFLKTFSKPVAAGLLVLVLQILLGRLVGFPPVLPFPDDMDPSKPADFVLGHFARVFPLLVFASSAFVLGAVVQEFWHGAAVRVKKHAEGVVVALLNLFAKNRRRYGGYVVHVGIVFIFLGFAGHSYRVEHEAALRVGQSFRVGGYHMTFQGFETEVDSNKRALYARVDVRHNGGPLAMLRPAKFVYRTHPDMPTTEIALYTNPARDLYLIVGAADPVAGVANIKATINPLTMWLWIGALVLVFGSVVAMWPEARLVTVAARSPAKAAAATAATRLVALVLAAGALAAVVGAPRSAHAQSQSMDGSTSPLPVGTVEMRTPDERRLFSKILCMCGDCERLPMTTCTCGFAERRRASMRAQLAAGASVESIVAGYVREFGARALQEPPDNWFNRMAWLVPLGAGIAGAILVVWLVRLWSKRGRTPPTPATPALASADRAAYDQRIADELGRLDE